MKAPDKLYERLTAEERGRAFIEAAARLDVEELDRLNATCPQRNYRGEDDNYTRFKLGTMVVTLMAHQQELRITADFKRILAAAPNVQLVHVNLEVGGLVDEGNLLGDAIRSRKLSTYTSSECVSACTFVFMGGTERYLRKGARLGFHALKQAGVETDVSYRVGRDRLVALGVTPDFAERAFKTTHDSMWYPTEAELIQAHVVTAIVSGEGFGLSGFRRQTVLDRLEDDFLKTPLFKAVNRLEPNVFSRIIAKAKSGVEAGRSIEDLRPEIMPEIVDLIAKYLPFSSDSAILAYTNFMTDVARAMNSSPQVCLGYLRDGTSQYTNAAVRLYTPELRAREAQIMTFVLDTVDMNRTPPTIEQKEKAVTAAFEHLMKRSGKESIVVLVSEKPDPASWCAAFTTFYGGLAELPAHIRRAAVIGLREG